MHSPVTIINYVDHAAAGAPLRYVTRMYSRRRRHRALTLTVEGVRRKIQTHNRPTISGLAAVRLSA